MNLKSKINHLFESRVSKKQASSSTFYAHSSSLEIISSAMTNKVSELTLSAHPYQLSIHKPRGPNIRTQPYPTRLRTLTNEPNERTL